MRPPRMTMRRWMIAAMTIALVLGCYREAIRLKQKRAVCLMRATWHAEDEAYHRRGVLAWIVRSFRTGRPVPYVLADHFPGRYS